MIKNFLVGLLLLAAATLTAAQTQSGSPPDLNGVWKLNSQKSDLNDDYRYGLSRGEQSVSLTQKDSEIRLTRHYASGDANSIVYTDGRAASNRDTNGDTVKTTTKWEGAKL